MPSTSIATTYYVDSLQGRDSNSGLTQQQAWRTAPGMRQADNSGWLRKRWGAISPTNPLAASDHLELRAGSRFNTPWRIDSTFFTSGSPNKPTVVAVAAHWGSGTVVIDGSQVTLPRYQALVSISQLNYLNFHGNADANLVLQQSPSAWCLAADGTRGTALTGLKLRNLSVRGCRQGGLNLSFVQQFELASSQAHGNGTVGIAMGGINDETVRNGRIEDVIAFDNGGGKTSGIRHGFGFWGALDVSCNRCQAYGNARDGFDLGSANNNAPLRMTVTNSDSWDNGEDGFATSGGSARVQVTYTNSWAANNGQAGWHIYDGAQVRVLHCLSMRNGRKNNFGGNFMVYSEHRKTQLTLRNSIGYAPAAYANVYSYRSPKHPTIIDSDHNLYIPRTTDSETFAETPYKQRFSYRRPPSWLGKHDRLGHAYAEQLQQHTQNEALLPFPQLSAQLSAHEGLVGKRLPDAKIDRSGVRRPAKPTVGLFQAR